ncbi:hypothetical protein J2755_001333 [Methanohalophilus levihalophilus]|uniref:hypothetical protein n=1 Tax=Methanohalophilus levihalophilus TaxID=1431282 RepID=UPI001AE3701E|nr:hypothetical protein [Methanohalophilus levihalophilus]MBP2030399.1 hypothetical protein [Methanohalophilus levihalophilus]
MYTEKAPLSFQMKIFLYGVLLVLLGMALMSYLSLFGFGGDNEEIYILASVIVVYLVAMQGILKLNYSVSSGGILVNYPPLKYRIPFSEIESVELEPGLAVYMGWGLRLHGRTLVFASSHDRGVRIRKNNGHFREVVLVSANPENLKKQIENMMGSFVHPKDQN